jgi:hypothetical protein
VRGDGTPMPVVLFILAIIIIGALLFAAVVVVSVGSMSLMSCERTATLGLVERAAGRAFRAAGFVKNCFTAFRMFRLGFGNFHPVVAGKN